MKDMVEAHREEDTHPTEAQELRFATNMLYSPCLSLAITNPQDADGVHWDRHGTMIPTEQDVSGAGRTVYELSATEFHRVVPLFTAMEHNRAALFSAIEGTSPGRVFVDHIENPATACVAVASSDLYLGGKASDSRFNTAFQHLLTTEVMPRLSSGTHIAHLMLYSASEGWRTTLDHLLEEHGGRRITRTQFTFRRQRFASLRGWRERIPEGFHMTMAG